jgi:adenylosuccinate synthase
MPVAAVLGGEGRGKIAAALSRGAAAYARFQGGPGASYAISNDGTEAALRMTPGGVLYGAREVIGAGFVIEPRMLPEEIASRQFACPDILSRLLISGPARVVTAAEWPGNSAVGPLTPGRRTVEMGR